MFINWLVKIITELTLASKMFSCLTYCYNVRKFEGHWFRNSPQIWFLYFYSFMMEWRRLHLLYRRIKRMLYYLLTGVRLSIVYTQSHRSLQLWWAGLLLHGEKGVTVKGKVFYGLEPRSQSVKNIGRWTQQQDGGKSWRHRVSAGNALTS